MFKKVYFSESTIQNKRNSICFHRVRECVASAILTVHNFDSKFNLYNILTKSLPGPLHNSIRERIVFIPSNEIEFGTM